MSNENLRNITNSFQDVQLISLASWRQAAEVPGRDRGGPYVVMQAGFDPNDPKMIADEFVLGRSGKWLSLSLFYRLPVPERRAEFVYANAAEVMQVMKDLPPKVAMHGGPTEAEAGAAAEGDEMAAAIEAAKGQSSGGAT